MLGLSKRIEEGYQMEHIEVTLNDKAAFDQAVSGDASLNSRGDLEFITIDNGTDEGRPAVVITFSVRLPDNSGGYRAQCVATVRELNIVLSKIQARYGDCP